MTFRSIETAPRRGPARRLGLAVACFAVAAAGTASAFQGDRVRIYSISQTREAAELVARAQGALSQPERRAQAFADLDRLLSRHRGDVLAPDEEARQTHPGAAEWARAALFGLSRDGLAAYAAAVGPDADAALAAALGSLDEAGLLEIVRRWPVAPAAERAWRALGDLEFERGHVHEAGLAWERARALGDLIGTDAKAAAEARERLLASTAARGDRASADGHWRLPGPGEATGVIPRADHERFAVALPDGPFSGTAIESDSYNLVPVLWGEQVFVTTSLRLLAVNAFDGSLDWMSPEPAGWERVTRSMRQDYFSGVDTASAVIAPAVGSGIAIAALQVPRFALDNDDFQGIVITVRLPERRLFAFDTATGEPLWNHAPPPTEELDGRPYAERMHVAGSPVVSGSRVLVPLARMQGRMQLHLGCFDLATGELLWSTYVISGQRELNMFNRHEREFVAPPVRVEGDRVILVSQLGTVAAFDLFTGHVLWQTTYEQIPLPPTRGWSPSERRREWKTAPAVVADGVVLATPIDGEDLLALDLETGRTLWSMPRSRLAPRRATEHQVDVLLGAREDAVLLGGGWVTAYRKPGGLRARGAGVAALPEFELGRRVEASPDRRPRPTLAAAGVAIATRDRLLVVEHSGDRPNEALSLPLEPVERGNVVVGEGGLYLANGRWLHGFLDLAQLEERARARLAQAPDDAEALLALTRLAVRRSAALADAGSLAAAVERLSEARAALLARLTRDANRAIAAEYGDVARREARLLARDGRTAPARALLREALQHAEPGRGRADLMLELHPLLLETARAEWLELLDALEREAAALDVPETALARLDPLWSRFALADAPSALRAVPVPLWLAVQRALDAERRGAFGAALEHWHQALALAGDRQLSEGIGAKGRVTELIGALLEVAGDAWYAPFESAARAELADASRGRDRRRLERLVELYPFASASDDARHLLVEIAHERGDVRGLVQAVLAPGRSRAVPDAMEARRLALLALGVGDAGNAEFQHGLLRALATSHPDLVIDVGPHAGKALREWSEAPRPGPASWERARLDATLSISSRPRGRSVLGPLPERIPLAETTGAQPWIVVFDGGIEAYPADGDDRPLWSAPLERPLALGGASAHQLFPTRIVLQQGDGLLGLDASNGHATWRWQPRAGQVLDVTGASGVLLVRTWHADGAMTATGIDPVSGIELWSLALPRERKWLAPIVGDRFAVYASEGFAVDTRLVVVDLFRGVVLGTFDCDENLGSRVAGWIQDGKLLLPSFLSQRLIAFDLESQTVPWTLRLPDGLDLFAVLTHRGAVSIVATPRERQGATRGGEILSVDLELGGTRSVHPLGADDRLLGIPRGTRRELASPFVFSATLSPGSVGTPITAIHMTAGRRWVHRLSVPPATIYEANWPAPAVSRDLVVLPFATRDSATRTARAVQLALLDISSGASRDARVLDPNLARVDELELHAVGNALWIAGTNRGRRDGRMEIWRTR